MLTRRELFLTAAAASLAGARTFRLPIGVQLYTVRKQIPEHAEETIRAIAEIGYREAEVARGDLDRLTPLLRKYKLAPVSSHIESGLVTGSWGSGKQVAWNEALQTMKAAGVKWAVMPYLPPADRGTGDFFKTFADKMNEAGSKCHEAGLQFAYHNHAFEFAGEPGKRPIDVMLAHLDPKLVGLEVDVFWVSVAGHDPVEFLTENKGRVPLLHLKDKASDQAVQYSESVKPATFREVGGGSLDFPKILATAAKIGVQHYFVEQDQTPGDPIASLRKSFEYLRKVQV